MGKPTLFDPVFDRPSDDDAVSGIEVAQNLIEMLDLDLERGVTKFGEAEAYRAVAPGQLKKELIELDTSEFASAQPPKADKPDKGNGGGGGGGGGKGGGKGKPGDGGGDPGDGTLTSYTSGGDAATSFNIEVTFSGTWTVALQDAFIKAADYFSSIILGDVTDIAGGIDDVTISAALIDIDGSGGVLGRAGPTQIRSVSYLPTQGIMEFDIADAANFDDQGLWDDIVFHEMAHVLGIGTLWDYMGLTAGSIAGGDLRYTGDLANAYYAQDFAGIDSADGFDFGIPVEMDGGPGTAGGHWDEALFNNEIMTGFINNSNYLSTMTIAAFEDMGYDTVLDDPNDASDLFGTIPTGDPLALV